MRRFCIGVDKGKQKLFDLDSQPRLTDYDSVQSEKLRENEEESENPWRGLQ
jgi:hypothetical protein